MSIKGMVAKFKKWKLARSYTKALGDHKRVLRVQEAYLKSKALPFCHRCYGRGHRGFNNNTGFYVACQCVSRNNRKLAKRAIAALKRRLAEEQNKAAAENKKGATV